MTLPLFDDISLPPDATLVDVNSLDEPERTHCQAMALSLWMEETGADAADFQVREWDDNEGIFIVVVGGETVGVAIIFDVEAVS